MIFTSKQHPIGTKLLVFSGKDTTYESILELEVLGYSPSNEFVKLSIDGGEYSQWMGVDNKDYEVAEELPSGKGKKTKQVLKG
jgi:hypothetical protein